MSFLTEPVSPGFANITEATGKRKMLSFSFALLAISAIFCAALHLYFYPPVYAFRDESDYLAMPYVFRQGTLWIDQTDVPVRSQVEAVNGHRVSDYAPGMFLLLFLWTFLGWKAVFILNLLMHLAGAWIFFKFLKLFEINNPFWTLLYLFYPPFILFSRTIMSDIPAMVFFLTGCLAYYRPGKIFWAGVCWGISTMIRETSLVFWFPFAMVSFWRALQPERRKDFGLLCLGFLPFGLAVLIYSTVLFGYPWTTGHGQSLNEVKHFSTEYFLRNLKHYGIHLMLVYPGMLLAALSSKIFRNVEILFSSLAGVLFHCFYFFHDQFSGALVTWIFGARFLFPVIPFLLAALAGFLDSVLLRVSLPGSRRVQVSLMILLIFSAGIVHFRHQRELQKQASVKDLLYSVTEDNSTIVYDANTAELIQRVWGRRNYHLIDEGDSKVLFSRFDLIRPVYLALRLTPDPGPAGGAYSLKLLGESHGLKVYRVQASNRV